MLAGGPTLNSPLRILVATDGSEAADHAVKWCAEFARTTGAEVVLMHTVSKVGEWLMSVAQIDFVKVESERKDLLERVWAEPLRKAEVPYRTKMVSGDPVKTIIALADDENADMIVIGKTGHSGVGSSFLGGSAAKISQHTSRPLLLIPSVKA
jgi:nucleotide-binding universal stress UspA family protein